MPSVEQYFQWNNQSSWRWVFLFSFLYHFVVKKNCALTFYLFVLWPSKFQEIQMWPEMNVESWMQITQIRAQSISSSIFIYSIFEISLALWFWLLLSVQCAQFGLSTFFFPEMKYMIMCTYNWYLSFLDTTRTSENEINRKFSFRMCVRAETRELIVFDGRKQMISIGADGAQVCAKRSDEPFGILSSSLVSVRYRRPTRFIRKIQNENK